MKFLKKNFPILLIFASAILFFSNLYADLKPPKKKAKALLESIDESLPQKPFVIITPSFNNEKYCERNLLSIFDQKYDNYRVVYVDDASTDQTLEKAQNFVRYKGEEGRVAFIKNETNQGALSNRYKAVMDCKDEEIVCFLDADDWFAHDKVLLILNTLFSSDDVWATHGSYTLWPSQKRGYDQKRIPESIHKKRDYREYAKKAFWWGHLHVSYAGLLKQVKLDSLLNEGKFYRYCDDAAWWLPVAEMIGEHFVFIKDILYIYNRDNPLNDDKKDFAGQQATRAKILSLDSYSPIFHWKPKWPDPKIDVVIHSDNRPLELLATLDSLESTLQGYRQIKVFYHAVTEETKAVYGEISKAYPSVHFYDTGREKEEIITYQMQNSGANYYLNIPGGRIILESIDLQKLALDLSMTKAESLYFEGEKGTAQLAGELTAFTQRTSKDLSKMALLTINQTSSPGLFLTFSQEKVFPCAFSLPPEKQCAYFREGLKLDIDKLKREDHEVAFVPHLL